MDTFPEQLTSISKDKNVYIGTDGIALGSGNFRVDSNGKLYANSGEFSGTIYADGGTIGGWSIAANSLSNRDGSISLSPDGLILGNQLNIDNQGNAYFGGTLNAASGTFSGELQAAKGTFSGDLNAAGGTFEGTLNAVDGNFRGVLSGATGSFTGAVTATSLTLGYGVTIGASKVSGLADVATSGSYNDLDDVPEIPTDLEYYIKKDGTVGSEPSEGATGFKVSLNGLLQASNAIIYGEIVASSGKIGGFNIATTADVSHYYTNTLYRITTDGTYYYQAGISSDGTSPTNATFYVRKSNYSNNWENSLVPFFVRNNGSLYAQDATIGTTLNICTDSSQYSSRIPILAYDRKGDTSNYQLTLGLLNSSSRISFDTQSVNFESFYGYEMMSVVSYDGTSAWLWKGDRCKTLDIGTSGRSFDNGYFKKLYLGGTDIETLIKTGSTPTGLKKNKIRIGSSDNGQGMGGGKEYVVYSDSTWSDTLPITCYTIGAASSSHTHSQYLTSHKNWGLSINGSTLTLVSGGNHTSVTLPTSSDSGGNYAPLYHTHDSITNGTNTLSISNAIYATGVSLGQESTRLKNAYFTGEIKCNSIYYNKLQAGAGSDINLKHNIHTFDKRIEEAYMDFESVSFNYNYYKAYDDEVDNNTYYGFIAQQIETSLNKHNISSETSGLVGYFQYDTPNAKGLTKEYYLSYLQFISLNTHMTQKAHHRIDSLESENQSLKNEILMLQGQLSLITQRLQKMEEKLC